MRIKIRSPAGAHVLTLPPDATAGSLLNEIREKSNISGGLDIKYGFPPKSLTLDEYPTSTPLSDLPVKLEGEQLTIASGGGGGVVEGTGSGVSTPAGSTSATALPKTGVYTPSSSNSSRSQTPAAPFSFAGGVPKPATSKQPPLSLTRKKPAINKDDPPVVSLKSGRGTVVLRVVPDDNSCLFRAISYAATRSLMSVEELRAVVAGTIQANPDKYNEVVLEQSPDAYCEWIQMDSSWGGDIEVGIFAEYFDFEITTIDVSNGSSYRANEGKARRIIIVYSGIHYDSVALSPAGSLVNDAENDEVQFEIGDEEIVQGARELCQKLREMNYFTDTKNFSIKCNTCGTGLKGEKEAVEHAKSTGHSDFGEY